MPRVDIKTANQMELERLSLGDWFLYNGEAYIRLEWVNSNMLRALKVTSGNRCDFPPTALVSYIDGDSIRITIETERE